MTPWSTHKWINWILTVWNSKHLFHQIKVNNIFMSILSGAISSYLIDSHLWLQWNAHFFLYFRCMQNNALFSNCSTNDKRNIIWNMKKIYFSFNMNHETAFVRLFRYNLIWKWRSAEIDQNWMYVNTAYNHTLSLV